MVSEPSRPVSGTTIHWLWAKSASRSARDPNSLSPDTTSTRSSTGLCSSTPRMNAGSRASSGSRSSPAAVTVGNSRSQGPAITVSPSRRATRTRTSCSGLEPVARTASAVMNGRPLWTRS